MSPKSRGVSRDMVKHIEELQSKSPALRDGDRRHVSSLFETGKILSKLTDGRIRSVVMEAVLRQNYILSFSIFCEAYAAPAF